MNKPNVRLFALSSVLIVAAPQLGGRPAWAAAAVAASVSAAGLVHPVAVLPSAAALAPSVSIVAGSALSASAALDAPSALATPAVPAAPSAPAAAAAPQDLAAAAPASGVPPTAGAFAAASADDKDGASARSGLQSTAAEAALALDHGDVNAAGTRLDQAYAGSRAAAAAAALAEYPLVRLDLHVELEDGWVATALMVRRRPLAAVEVAKNGLTATIGIDLGKGIFLSGPVDGLHFPPSAAARVVEAALFEEFLTNLRQMAVHVKGVERVSTRGRVIAVHLDGTVPGDVVNSALETFFPALRGYPVV